MRLFPQLILASFVALTLAQTAIGQRKLPPKKQPAEVVRAYRVCEQFQKVLSQTLDFDAAFRATFTTNIARQRAIAIKDGEFEGVDFEEIDDQTLIRAYKSRMQLIYLMFPLFSPGSDEEEATFFPPRIKAMFSRKAPETAEEFASFANQLEQDARDFRAHLNGLATRIPAVAERIRKFKADLVTGNFQPPKSGGSKALKYYGGGGVLANGESYYQIEGYTVVREAGQMKIVGIRFFTRLF